MAFKQTDASTVADRANSSWARSACEGQRQASCCVKLKLKDIIKMLQAGFEIKKITNNEPVADLQYLLSILLYYKYGYIG